MLKKSHTKRAAAMDFIAVALLLLSGAFLIWRAKFGVGNKDEAFYLTIPYRLINGDGLFLHEWHLSQMSGFLLIPFVWIYKSVVGSLDGIFLADRYLCAIIILLTAFFIYTRLKEDSPPPGRAGCQLDFQPVRAFCNRRSFL